VPQIGAGAMFTGYGDAACETSVQEALYVDQTDADFCSGSLKVRSLFLHDVFPHPCSHLHVCILFFFLCFLQILIQFFNIQF
jgi:hypothetical protein